MREDSRRSVGKWDRKRCWTDDGLKSFWGEFEFMRCVVAGKFHEYKFTRDEGDQHGTASAAAKYDRRVSLRTEAARLQNDKAGSAAGQRWRRHPRRRATLAALEGSWEELLRHAAYVAETYKGGTEAGYAADLLRLWKESEDERKAGGGFTAGWELGARAGDIRMEWLLWAVWGPQLSTAIKNRDDDGGSAAKTRAQETEELLILFENMKGDTPKGRIADVSDHMIGLYKATLPPGTERDAAIDRMCPERLRTRLAKARKRKSQL